ncbi:hypothetical protein A2773_04770 [Candidatus Gottesmanbacteria bacterium RIFCSPHIGHO2_01_FULL_39_10]|uniref:Phosphodiester glycosidase domain-containing protein n=1 Tax=Candidatus Gottesmanbacteria bacterium RIFCSPHIGHO2_01_FULL_39_10 TaxID=1798375 RepID=A0A1F5ZSS5_9BACT|nr:MAG: hypothetical protein A2773_04770 [Candidatus Gottesmanbacteria bacterium RIFCSPHIGHO2_01_FULL_39_10]
MKKIIIVFLIIIFGALVYTQIKPGKPSDNIIKEIISQPTPTPTISQSYEILYNNQKIAADIIPIENSSSLTLIPNFKEKLSTSQIMERNNCKAGANGGFYGKDDRPIGHFMNNDIYLGDMLVNHNFFNGFFVGIQGEGVGIISNKLTERRYKFIVQSGPYMDLWKPEKLSIINDEMARRVLVVNATRKINDGYTAEYYFMVLYDPDAQFSGPYLAQVPLILDKIDDEMGAKIVSSLNLDGGGASSFWNDNITLEELASVGSFFCIK